MEFDIICDRRTWKGVSTDHFWFPSHAHQKEGFLLIKFRVPSCCTFWMSVYYAFQKHFRTASYSVFWEHSVPVSTTLFNNLHYISSLLQILEVVTWSNTRLFHFWILNSISGSIYVAPKTNLTELLHM